MVNINSNLRLIAVSLQAGTIISGFIGEAKIIVYAWVNDEDNKRAFAGTTDAYKVFAKMLKLGNPPDDWDSLLTAARGAKLTL
ncbi:type II toxin-antitoxin system YhaV family toxin [Rheinheimera sp. YQF-2]|uniref:Type II toxin-antitoxin system YhaV family toxin n=1 Tax=Rheinheimera lutimaris TaxID=2740584 RepID=A0A7Y5EJQ9_9GAMM|nr:type II toxin-antitoxin system YhaV family toxin [Rheinheimera lutimaris]NRQ41353.1 type II toxin-antitoxin system YhaV family toxin [Rheinheimera lutimaris]